VVTPLVVFVLVVCVCVCACACVCVFKDNDKITYLLIVFFILLDRVRCVLLLGFIVFIVLPSYVGILKQLCVRKAYSIQLWNIRKFKEHHTRSTFRLHIVAEPQYVRSKLTSTMYS